MKTEVTLDPALLPVAQKGRGRGWGADLLSLISEKKSYGSLSSQRADWKRWGLTAQGCVWSVALIFEGFPLCEGDPFLEGSGQKDFCDINFCQVRKVILNRFVVFG